MGVILCHRSAFDLHRMDCPTEPFSGSLAAAWEGGDVNARLADVVRRSPSQARYLREPYHLLVPGEVKRRPSHGVVLHGAGVPLPSGSLRRVAPGLLVVSVECALRQMSADERLLDIVLLCYEACGCYRMGPGEDRLFDQGRLTTVDRLKRHVQASAGLPGAGALGRALRFVRDDSFSPAETAAVLLLCLPRRMGGYGLPWPEMNHRVDLGARRRSAAGRSYLICDLYWPGSRLDVEYDSDLCHTGSQRIAQDAMRRADLFDRGISVLTLTKGQLYDEEGLDVFAAVLARQLGYRLRPVDARGLASRRALRSELLGSRC
ncbi:MAG: hypothetical protein HFJ75_03320 [Eggerthellaceae bacterium]|nr:hypothetical protein [Eggerthellaceae bacterium]